MILVQAHGGNTAVQVGVLPGLGSRPEVIVKVGVNARSVSVPHPRTVPAFKVHTVALGATVGSAAPLSLEGSSEP